MPPRPGRGRGDSPVGPGQRLAEPIERRPRAGRVALGEALGGVAQAPSPAAPSACDAVACSSASWRRELALLLGRHLVELVAEVLRGRPRAFSGSPSLFASGLPVAARDSDRLSDVSDAARCSFAGSTWARTSASIDPSRRGSRRGRPGCSRSWRARSRSSWASRVRGSSGVGALRLELVGDSSIRSAWRSAASRTCCCWAITASCGFGSSGTGTSRSARDAAATAAGRREKRGRNRPGGRHADRPQRIAALAADEPVGLGRFVERPSVVGGVARRRPAGPADAGKATASSSALETRSPRPPSASTASAVSPTPGRARTPGDQPAERRRRPGWPRRRPARARAGRTGRPSTARVPRPTTRREREPRAPDDAGGPTAGGGTGRRPARSGRQRGIERAVERRQRIGRDDDRRWPARRAVGGPGSATAAASGGLLGAGADRGAGASDGSARRTGRTAAGRRSRARTRRPRSSARSRHRRPRTGRPSPTITGLPPDDRARRRRCDGLQLLDRRTDAGRLRPAAAAPRSIRTARSSPSR